MNRSIGKAASCWAFGTTAEEEKFKEVKSIETI